MGTTWQTKPHKWWLGGLLMMVFLSRDFEWVYFDFLRNARMVTRMDQSYLLWFWSAIVPLCHGDECVTVWILLDLKRTRPKRITQSVLKAIRKKVILSLSPKISWRFRKFFWSNSLLSHQLASFLVSYLVAKVAKLPKLASYSWISLHFPSGFWPQTYYIYIPSLQRVSLEGHPEKSKNCSGINDCFRETFP